MTEFSKKKAAGRYSTIMTIIIIAMFASIFTDKYSLWFLIPATLGGSLLYYLFQYGELPEKSLPIVMGIAIIFLGREYGHLQNKNDLNRLLSNIESQCRQEHLPNSSHCQEILYQVNQYKHPDVYEDDY